MVMSDMSATVQGRRLVLRQQMANGEYGDIVDHTAARLALEHLREDLEAGRVASVRIYRRSAGCHTVHFRLEDGE
jgi:hypothetical protein